jgi:hypothetical protein
MLSGQRREHMHSTKGDNTTTHTSTSAQGEAAYTTSERVYDRKDRIDLAKSSAACSATLSRLGQYSDISVCRVEVVPQKHIQC